jgi:hypothetical protein
VATRAGGRVRPDRDGGAALGDRRAGAHRAAPRGSVEDAVKSSGLDTQDWYAFATTWERESAILGGLAAGMGLSDAQLDDLFREAAAVS